MGYVVFTHLNFTRIHLCQYCGHPFEYEVKKLLHSNAVSEKAGRSAIQVNAVEVMGDKIRLVPCPHCSMIQNAMIYSGVRLFARVASWILIIGFLLYSPILLGLNSICSNLFNRMITAWCLDLFPGLLMLFAIFQIQYYFGKMPNLLKYPKDLDEEAVETYRITRKYYRSLQIFLICTFPAIFVPFLGPLFGIFSMLIYIVSIYKMPSYIAEQGLPLLCKDVEFKH